MPYDLAEEGGVKRHALHLAERLRRRGDDVTVIGPLDGGQAGEGVQGFRGVVNVPANGADNRMAIFTPPWTLVRFFRDHVFDVVHVHEPLVPVLGYYALGLTPSSAHVVTFHMYAESEARPWRWLRRGVARLLDRRIQRAIAVSRAAKAYAEDAWPRPLTVIPNGVPLEVFRPPPPAPPPTAPLPMRLLFVGHWRDPRKGLAWLVEAYRALRRDGVAVTLDVVGAGTPGPPEPVEGVTFHGAVASEEELAGHYRSCDVFVAPATGQESFGIVLLEAMATGRPVVCSDIEGYRDVVAPGGARLVAPRDVEGLAAALRGLAQDPGLRERMGVINRRAVQAYDWDSVAERVRAEYVEALAVRIRS